MQMEITQTIIIFDVIALVGIMLVSAAYMCRHKFH